MLQVNISVVGIIYPQSNKLWAWGSKQWANPKLTESPIHVCYLTCYPTWEKHTYHKWQLQDQFWDFRKKRWSKKICVAEEDECKHQDTNWWKTTDLFSKSWSGSERTLLQCWERQAKLNRLTYFCAASVSVPQVSAISSTRIAVRSLTSPTRTMLATSLATFRWLHKYTNIRALWLCSKWNHPVNTKTWIFILKCGSKTSDKWEKVWIYSPQTSPSLTLQLFKIKKLE